MPSERTDSAQLGREAIVAARWWADKLRDEFVLDHGAPQDPLETALMGVVQKRMREQVTAARVDAFETALAPKIQAMLDRGASSYETAMLLGVDYGPSLTLGEALEEAGLPDRTGILPFKTCMWVQPGSVKVGDGYAAEPKELALDV